MAEDNATASELRTRWGFLVRRRRENCYLRTNWSGSRRLPGDRNVRIFRSRDAAYDFMGELNSGRVPPPSDANPFLIYHEGFDGDSGGYAVIYKEAEADFIALIRGFGFEPPGERELKSRHYQASVDHDWYAWWEENAPKMTPEQRASIWQTFDEYHSYYEVVELTLLVPPGDPLFPASGSS